MSVDLPAPLGPTIPTSLPSGTSRSMSHRTGLRWYATVMSWISSAGVVACVLVLVGLGWTIIFKCLFERRNDRVNIRLDHAKVVIGARLCGTECIGVKLTADFHFVPRLVARL